MGSFHLWGYYNDHPVYQHYSGLDFLYFHKNQVCNAALTFVYSFEFSSVHCPGLGDRTKGWGEASGSFELLGSAVPVRDDLAVAVWDEAAGAGPAD